MNAAIAVTGGIGSGKSTLCQLFATQGIPVLNLDSVGHQRLAYDHQLRQSLVNCFGQQIVNDQGDIHRPALAAIVFADADKLQQLNALMHPAIRQYEHAWRHQQHSPFAIIEASALLESGHEHRMDAVVVVLTKLEIRKQRVLARGQHDEASFLRVVARQCSDDLRRQRADYILENNGSQLSLAQQQQTLLRQLQQRFG